MVSKENRQVKLVNIGYYEILSLFHLILPVIWYSIKNYIAVL